MNRGTLRGLGQAPARLGLGWVTDLASWIYVSADGPIGVIDIAGDATSYITLGTRVRYMQTTLKYGIVHAIGTYGASTPGKTRITVYGGTDYTTANALITDPATATGRSPYGFNSDVAKWQQEVIVGSGGTGLQATPTQNVMYNPGSNSIDVPIGAWDLEFQFGGRCQTTSGQTSGTTFCLLSTDTSTLAGADSTGQSINVRTRVVFLVGAIPTTVATGQWEVRLPGARSMRVSMSAKTTLYVMTYTNVGSAVMNSIGYDVVNCSILLRVRSAYV